MKSFAYFCFMIAAAVAMTSSFAMADTPGKHPAYIHALADLRSARAFLYYKPVNRIGAEEQRAIDEIDAAIHAITEAAIDDGKPMNDRFPSDVSQSRTDRLHRAQELLEQARADVKEHESNGWSKAYKDRAVHHIDQARKALKKAIDREMNE
jgi:hypothetical protein